MPKKQRNDMFDSDEELFFSLWLEELRKRGYLEYVYKPNTFRLFNGSDYKLKFKSGSITLRNLDYTPDFSIRWNEKLRGKLFSVPGTDDKKSIFVAYNIVDLIFVSVVDVKGGFTRGHGANSSAITFPLKQKMLLKLADLYVQKIIPVDKKKGLFTETFTPASYLLTDTGKNRKLHYKPILINKYLEDNGIR